MSDPLAGQREALNQGRDSLLWKPGEKCPVKVGDVFELRTCGIEITALHKIRTRGEYWGGTRAEFRRIMPESRSYFLGKRGYTHNPEEALKADDDPTPATLDVVSPDAREERHRSQGEPPEPEAVPPHEVAQLSSTITARARYLQVQAEVNGQALAERNGRHLVRRLRKLQEDAERYGVDLTPKLIGMIREAECEVGEARRTAA